MIKAILFDLDGVLVDTEPVFYNSYVEILKKYGYDFSLKEYVDNYLGRTLELNSKAFVDNYHLPMSYQDFFDAIGKLERDSLNKQVTLKKGTLEILQYLKENDYKVVLATSSVKERANMILEKSNIKQYFDGIVTGEDVNNGKPNPEIYLKAMEISGCEKNECLVVEDATSGILAGLNALIEVACIIDLKAPEEIHLNRCTFVGKSLLELIQYLKGVSY